MSIRIPANADRNTQDSFRDIEQALNELRAAIDRLGGPRTEVAAPEVSRSVSKSGDVMSGVLENGGPVIEATSWNNTTGIRLGKTSTSIAMDSLLNCQLQCAATAGGASYQKAAGFFFTRIADPSTYGPDETHDAVGIDSRGQISSTNSFGRAWGAYLEALVETGGDGTLVGAEVDVYNRGTDQAAMATTTSKTGVSVVIAEGNGTSAISITSAGASVWHKGIHADEANIGTGANDAFIELATNKFVVKGDGDIITAGSLATTDQSIGTLSTGNNNNLSVNGAGAARFALPAGAISVTGFVAGRGGQILYVFFDGAGTVTLVNDATSTAANRIYTLQGADVVMRAGNCAAIFVYNTAYSRWVLYAYN